MAIPILIGVLWIALLSIGTYHYSRLQPNQLKLNLRLIAVLAVIHTAASIACFLTTYMWTLGLMDYTGAAPKGLIILIGLSYILSAPLTLLLGFALDAYRSGPFFIELMLLSIPVNSSIVALMFSFVVAINKARKQVGDA